VLAREVLISELLAVDGLATSAVATGEVTTLKHELRDDAMEGGVGISKALLTGAESAEVLSGLWDDVVVEVEVDAAGLLGNLRGRLARGIEDWALPGNVEVSLDGHVEG